jgi:hypothetical protein
MAATRAVPPVNLSLMGVAGLNWTTNIAKPPDGPIPFILGVRLAVIVALSLVLVIVPLTRLSVNT